jgi:glutathionyl-hydroquinone reductase
VPVLWDKQEHTIVNNESAEIIRMFNSEFNDFLPTDKANLDLYPAKHAAEIDAINESVYDTVNSTRSRHFCIQPLIFSVDGVYKAGFASSQSAYEHAVTALFESLDKLEKILTGKEYLIGGQLTEADIRLWVTIVSSRFRRGSLTMTNGRRSDSILFTSDTLNATSGLSEMGTRPFTREFPSPAFVQILSDSHWIFI